MQVVDHAEQPRIAALLNMVRTLSKSTDPREAVETFIAGMRTAQAPRAFLSVSTRGLSDGDYRIMRLLGEDGIDRLGWVGHLENQNEIPVCRGGFVSRIIGDSRPRIFVDLNVRDDSHLKDHLAAYQSAMVAPLFIDGQPGDWVMLLGAARDEFSARDLEDFLLRTNLLAVVASNVLVGKQLRDAGRYIQREVDQIAAIQRGLLPAALPRIPGVSLAANYDTFDRAGGDYYDVINLSRLRGATKDDDNGPWGLLIADVSGHGPSAAVVVAIMHTLVSTCTVAPDTPLDFLRYLNKHLTAKSVSGSFVTAFFGIYDPVTRRMQFANAGQNPPLVREAGGKNVRVLSEVTGMPMGLVDPLEAGEGMVTLQSGQTLVLYTDGIVEEVGPDGTQFGLERLIGSVTRAGHGARPVLSAVLEDLRSHQDWTRPEDDQTLLVMHVE